MGNIKNPKGSTFEKAGLMLLGVALGAFGSRALMAVVPNKTGLTAAEQKTQDMVKIGARITASGGGFAGAAYAIENNANPLLIGAGLGAGAIQLLDLSTDFAGSNAKITSTVNSGTKTGKILGKALALNCPCDNVTVMQPLARPRKRTSQLRGGYPGETLNNHTAVKNPNAFML